MRRGLATAFVGRRVVEVHVGRERVVRRTSADALRQDLTGRRIVSADRRGKYLLCPLDSGRVLMVHLRMSGQVRFAPHGSPRPAHTHVAAVLDDGTEFRFVDPRTFGEVVVFDPARVASDVPELARLGVDPIADPFDVDVLRRVVRRGRGGLKATLLDQHRIAGIGNIYGDEILHRAGLHPLRRTDTLSFTHERRLADSIVGVLAEAIEAGGSTLGDAQYVDVAGRAGTYQHRHRVYGRAGERCPTCGRGRIRRIVVAQRSTHYCAWCQQLRSPRSAGSTGPTSRTPSVSIGVTDGRAH